MGISSIRVLLRGVLLIYILYMPFIWIAVMVLAAVLEASTAQLVSIWFVVGGIGGLIASLVGASVSVQVLIFALVSAVTLIATRPFVKKVLDFKTTGTNADRYLGKIAVVTVEINNTLGVGQVNVLGSIWTARSSDGSVIPVGSRVSVESIDGVKLIVRLKTD
ncbi:NfeD family protein [Caproicibacter fermentans]|uniref:NfeD family protein n=1 Tax=Caproicibacter fermentans TaxID=2576756 RepID=A0A7G8TBB7_9FIRM|nr:NfeD family protein [Caproicibacter fermentans]